MLITMKAWGLVREQFTQAEKDRLNRVKTNDVICPQGIMIDETRLKPILQAKIKNAITKANSKLPNKDKR